MLLRFRCKNFRSIRDEQELSLVAAKTRSTDERKDSLLETPIKGVQAVRSAAIYGANASGKSNVLRAMRVFSRMVARSQSRWIPTESIPTWDPFALNETSRDGETEFQIDFVLEQQVYNYGFRFNQAIFTEEWLINKTNTDTGRELFRRTTTESTVSVKYTGKNLKTTAKDTKHLQAIESLTRPNSLFLSSAAQNNHEMLSTVYKWIVDRFHMLSTETPTSPRLFTADFCSKRPDIKVRVTSLLRFADLGITDFSVTEIEAPEDMRKFQSAFNRALREVHPEAASDSSDASVPPMHEIKMVHLGEDEKLYSLDFGDESDGTKTYFAMLGPLLDILENSTLVLIDELEGSLHPHLAKPLVRIFNDPMLNPKGAQLIFATHDTNLLDLDLMRRDQFWFTEKNKYGATVLKPLSDYKPRTDQNIEAAYLHGRFGAIPFLDETELLKTPVTEKAS